MAQKWFKFYGQDWLTDTKAIKLDPIQRLCFITLLCMASASDIQGTIKDLDEETLLLMTHLYNDPYNDENDYTRGKGILEKLVGNGMITNDNGLITIKNFTKRQEIQLTPYERVKKYRAKKQNDNPREEENRIDKNRKEDVTTPTLLIEFKLNPLWDQIISKYPDRDYELEFGKMADWWISNKKKLPKSISAWDNWLKNTKADPALQSQRMDKIRRAEDIKKQEELDKIPLPKQASLDKLREEINKVKSKF